MNNVVCLRPKLSFHVLKQFIAEYNRLQFSRNPNIMSKTNIPCVASGGVSAVNDIDHLKKQNYSSLKGVIVGKAIYDNEFDIKSALEILR